jgi:hypothetical protein
MKVERNLPQVPMAPADVLEAIRETYRFAAKLDPEAEPDVDLTLTTTVAEWRRACDLVGPRALGRALNEWFGVTASDAEWLAALEPSKRVTLAGVCGLVAAKGAMRPVAHPARLAGGECAAAGAFLTIRALLARDGGAAVGLPPSTLLSSLDGRRLVALVSVMGKLAPGVLPVPRVVTSRAARLNGWLLLTSVFALLFAGLVEAPWYPAACFAGIAAAIVGVAISSRIWPQRYEFDEPATLGAVARAAIQDHTPPT